MVDLLFQPCSPIGLEMTASTSAAAACCGGAAGARYGSTETEAGASSSTGFTQAASTAAPPPMGWKQVTLLELCLGTKIQASNVVGIIAALPTTCTRQWTEWRSWLHTCISYHYARLVLSQLYLAVCLYTCPSLHILRVLVNLLNIIFGHRMTQDELFRNLIQPWTWPHWPCPSRSQGQMKHCNPHDTWGSTKLKYGCRGSAGGSEPSP